LLQMRAAVAAVFLVLISIAAAKHTGGQADINPVLAVSNKSVVKGTKPRTEVITHKGPVCKLSVTNTNDESVSSSVVGKSLKLHLQVQPNETYSIMPLNCFIVNMDTREQYSLTDKAGCAVDEQKFPQWTRTSKSTATAVFRTFKWANSSMIRFKCDCVACVGECPQFDCSKSAVARRKLRLRRHNMEEKGEEIVEAAEDLRISHEAVDSETLAVTSLVNVEED
ncbi:hypothetical protein PFISCL1PPCAC_11371, partial [Pristionchus fissidentatus]